MLSSLRVLGSDGCSALWWYLEKYWGGTFWCVRLRAGCDQQLFICLVDRIFCAFFLKIADFDSCNFSYSGDCVFFANFTTHGTMEILLLLFRKHHQMVIASLVENVSLVALKLRKRLRHFFIKNGHRANRTVAEIVE